MAHSQKEDLERLSTVQGKMDQRILDAVFIGMVRGSVSFHGSLGDKYVADKIVELVAAHRELSQQVAHA